MGKFSPLGIADSGESEGEDEVTDTNHGIGDTEPAPAVEEEETEEKSEGVELSDEALASELQKIEEIFKIFDSIEEDFVVADSVARENGRSDLINKIEEIRFKTVRIKEMLSGTI